MKASYVKIAVLVLVVVAAAFGYLEFPRETSEATPQPAPQTAPRTAPASSPRSIEPPPAPGGLRRVVENARIKNYGDVIYSGPVDLSATIERILAGERHSHRNDGSVFGNREGLLPRKPRGYYREYVHPTEGINGPGPQRVVVGADGDWWYTPDHYASFIELGREVTQ